jgi:hypothetical protein
MKSMSLDRKDRSDRGGGGGEGGGIRSHSELSEDFKFEAEPETGKRSTVEKMMFDMG